MRERREHHWRSRAALGGLLALCITAGAGPARTQPAERQPAKQPAEKQPSEKQSAEKQPSGEGVDEEADRILRRMSDYLEKQKAFTFTGHTTTEVVTEDGQKLEFDATANVQVKRPNRLRSDRVGAYTDMTLFYDGNEIALLGRKANLYATAKAPKTLDGAIDFARDRLGLETPGADLLFSDVYSSLTEDVTSGQLVGRETLDGVPVDHLAFRGPEVDFQLWIEPGARPLPRKFVITSKDVEGQPEFSVRLDKWDVNATIPNETFEFDPPANAARIDFMGTRKEAMDKVQKSPRRKP